MFVAQLGLVSWVVNWRLSVHSPSLPNKNLLTTRTKLLAFYRSGLSHWILISTCWILINIIIII